MDPQVNYVDVAYIGYSLICDTPLASKRVRNFLSQNSSTRVVPMTSTEFAHFFFLKPQRRMSKDAFDCWRKRNNLQDLRVCMHTDEATAVEGLLATMKLATNRYGMIIFLPSEVGRGYGRYPIRGRNGYGR